MKSFALPLELAWRVNAMRECYERFQGTWRARQICTSCGEPVDNGALRCDLCNLAVAIVLEEKWERMEPFLRAFLEEEEEAA